MMSAFQRFQSFLVALPCFLAACASTPTEAPRAEVLVVLRNYQSGQRFELASESHTDRVAYYSSERGDAVRKVQVDEVMLALVAELDKRDYGTHARPGRAPESGNESTRWALELESGERELNWTIGTNDPRERWLAFQECRDLFLELYNATVSFQTVENQAGRGYFQEPQASTAPKRR